MQISLSPENAKRSTNPGRLLVNRDPARRARTEFLGKVTGIESGTQLPRILSLKYIVFIDVEQSSKMLDNSLQGHLKLMWDLKNAHVSLAPPAQACQCVL